MQCLLEEVLKYHDGYHIPKLWAYVNHGSFLAILNQVTTQTSELRQSLQRHKSTNVFKFSEAYAMVVRIS